jgi:hypothetical protein
MVYLCFHTDLTTGERCFGRKENPYGICPKCHRFPINQHLKFLNLADELDKLQASKNKDRGVSCVQTLVCYLYTGDLDKAKAVYRNDGDKICCVYPDLDKMICVGLDIKPRYSNCGWTL